ncbi:MAG TPA: N-acetylmuramoyl-L-alanine amidase, partial [Candidatus Absconditabacterales bacterium]|nr:N-acetylmuramoyl-L-alanine amidase [Candidatus Absconditabacterales bacterium]
RNLPGIKIITRDQRGANEALRYSDMSRTERSKVNAEKNEQKMNELRETDAEKYWSIKEKEYQEQMANDYLKSNYYSEIDLDWTKYESNGNYLFWPEYIKNNKTKIIVHHTASDNTILKNKADVLEYLSGVYRYHTVTNGRGDIGYNFLIDPFGNIYEGRAGGEGVVGAHAKRNNTPSIGISLIGNFENVKPTKEALESLIRLSAALAKKYNINPFSRTDYHKDSKEVPYIVSAENYVIAGHKDAGITACPGKYLYELLPFVRNGVKDLLEGKTLTSASGLKSVKETITSKQASKAQRTRLTYDYFESMQSKIAPAVRAIKNDYINKNNITFSKGNISRLIGKIDKNQAKTYLNQDILVLLYELTQDYSEYNLSCEQGCIFYFNQNKLEANNATIKVSDKLQLNLGGNTYNVDRLSVVPKNSLISIDNYTRKSYAGIAWNTFRGSLIFKKDYMKDLNGVEQNKYVVINKLPFGDYMKGIAETNDTESATKNEVMSLISKSYALFYMNPKNIHPNIPSQATYNAVDDSRIFQKYVGAGLEKTLTKWYTALEKTKNKIVLYNNNVPLLPYFSCSAGFTYSANEKRGRNDTPYLKSKFDLGICQDKKFAGHGVGLSGLGAERRAKFGWSYTDILRYYYPGIVIENL